MKESDAEDVLKWISLIAMEDNIEHVSEQMLERLLQDHKVMIKMNLYSREKAFRIKTEQVDCNDDLILSFQILAVYFYDSSFVSDTKLLKDLETIDDDLDREGVILVRLAVTGTSMESAEAHLAQKFGVDIVPSLVLFKYGRPHRFEGEITDEKDAIAWLRSKLAS